MASESLEPDDSREVLTAAGSAPANFGRALVLENSLVLAMDLAQQLKRIGVGEVELASTEAAAMALLESDHFDFALLDMKLKEGATFDVARRLAARGTPFLFVTGFGRRGLPADLADQLVLTKPIRFGALRDAVLGLAGGGETMTEGET